MGNMTEKEKIMIGIVAIIFYPFVLIGNVAKSIGTSLGLIKPETYEYDPTKDPNSPQYKDGQ